MIGNYTSLFFILLFSTLGLIAIGYVIGYLVAPRFSQTVSVPENVQKVYVSGLDDNIEAAKCEYCGSVLD